MTISRDMSTGLAAGSTLRAFITYNGTTKTAGTFDGGTTAPSSTTRLNYDGNFYATTFYGAGTGLTGTASSLSIGGNAATATSATSATTATHLAGGGAGTLHYNTAAGASTQLAAGTNGQMLYHNGTAPYWGAGIPSQTGNSGKFLTTNGTAASWGTVTAPVFSKEYISTAQTITSAGLLTLAHGLGVVPKFVQLVLKNTTAEGGYSVGDELLINPNVNGPTAARGTSVVVDSTNVNIRIGSAGYEIPNKTTGAAFVVVNTSWSLIVRAWA